MNDAFTCVQRLHLLLRLHISLQSFLLFRKWNKCFSVSWLRWHGLLYCQFVSTTTWHSSEIVDMVADILRFIYWGSIGDCLCYFQIKHSTWYSSQLDILTNMVPFSFRHFHKYGSWIWNSRKYKLPFLIENTQIMIQWSIGHSHQ